MRSNPNTIGHPAPDVAGRDISQRAPKAGDRVEWTLSYSLDEATAAWLTQEVADHHPLQKALEEIAREETGLSSVSPQNVRLVWSK